MDVGSIFAAMQQHAELAAMPFLNFNLFLRCESQLKDDILQPQPHTISVLVAPEVLPPSINAFLAAQATLSEEAVDVLWGITKDLIWALPTLAQAVADEEEAFRRCGHGLGITKHTLYPPIKRCINPNCDAWRNNTLFKKEEQ